MENLKIFEHWILYELKQLTVRYRYGYGLTTYTCAYLCVSRYADIAQVFGSKHAIFPQVTVLLPVIGPQQLHHTSTPNSPFIGLFLFSSDKLD